jgi:hypothetical protein
VCVPFAALCICGIEPGEPASHDQLFGTFAWLSNLSILPPRCGNAHCNSVLGDDPAGISIRSLSANTYGHAVVSRIACGLFLLLDFETELSDVQEGPWEFASPRSSSLEGDPFPFGAL